jgi:hypothetical protein
MAEKASSSGEDTSLVVDVFKRVQGIQEPRVQGKVFSLDSSNP